MKLTQLMIAGLIACAPMAHAGVVSLDLSSLYNIDGVANPGDTTQTSLDTPNDGGNYVFMTQSLATSVAGAGGQGLIDNGVYAANGYHPQVQMGYGVNPNGNNVLNFSGDTALNLAMGGKHYSQIDVAAMTGGGGSNLTLIFHYADGNVQSRTAYVNDWYDDFVPNADNYYFVDGMDRIQSNLGSFENANDPALFGYRFLADASRELVSIDFVAGGTSAYGAHLNIFGAAATGTDLPEPGSIALMLIGMAGLMAYRRKSS